MLVGRVQGKDDVVHVLLTERSMQVSTHKGKCWQFPPALFWCEITVG